MNPALTTIILAPFAALLAGPLLWFEWTLLVGWWVDTGTITTGIVCYVLAILLIIVCDMK